jgi:hypothetical protein
MIGIFLFSFRLNFGIGWMKKFFQIPKSKADKNINKKTKQNKNIICNFSDSNSSASGGGGIRRYWSSKG